MNPKFFVPIFVDAKPNEVLDHLPGHKLCLVSLQASNMEGVPELTAYKKTRRKRKIAAARRIRKHLESGEIVVDVFGLAGRTDGQFASIACATINQSREAIGAEWILEGTTPKSLRFNGHTYALTRALGLMVYAAMLPILGLRAAVVNREKRNVLIKLCLDALPFSSEEGLQLIAALSKHSDINSMWQANSERGFGYQYGVLRNGRRHPNFILTDWLAASCLAKANPSQLKDEGRFSDDEVCEIAAILDSANAHGSAQLFDVDDPDVIESVRVHQIRHA
jgi:hypothetical protein